VIGRDEEKAGWLASVDEWYVNCLQGPEKICYAVRYTIGRTALQGKKTHKGRFSHGIRLFVCIS